MASLEIKKESIPLWSGANGSLVLNIVGDPFRPVDVGASPIADASFRVDGNQNISFARTGTAALGIQAGAHARILPIFQENVGSGEDLVSRFCLTDSLKSDNLLLAFEVGADANLAAQGAFNYSVLSATARLNAGADATYVTVRSFPRTTALQPMLTDMMSNLTLPACVTRPPAPGDLVSFEYGGLLNFKVGACAGYEIKGTKSLKISEIMLSEHYDLAVIGKLSFAGEVAGRFSVDVTAGSEPGFARVVVRRRRQKELQFAADVNVKADLTTEGLPSSGKEFLGALLGVNGKNWLNLVDGLVTKAGQVDSIDALKTKLDGLAIDYLGAFAGKAIDQITAAPDIRAFQDKLAKVVDSYRNLDQRAIALFDRYFEPAVNRIGELTTKLNGLNALTSFNELKGEVDPVLWNVLGQLTDGDALGWLLGKIPGSNADSLSELKKRIQSALSLIGDDVHGEIRNFIGTAKSQFNVDALFDQLATLSSPQGLKAVATQHLGHFVGRLIGEAVDKLNPEGLNRAFAVVQQVVKARDRFFATFDNILKEAAAQSFAFDLHAAYNSASESQALIDMEIKLQELDGSPNAMGLRLMGAAGRGDFQEALAKFQPAVVKLNQGLLTHKITAGTSLIFNIAGWHHSFHYEALHRVIVQTQQQIRKSGPGVLTVFSNIDMTAGSEHRRRGSKSEEAILTNFLLRSLAESKLSDSTFDEKTQLYLLDVITGMTAQYSILTTDTDTSSTELDEYLQFATTLGLDKVGATRTGLAPYLEYRNGSFGKIESDYEVRYTEAGLRHLIAARPTDAEIRSVLRRIVLTNYFKHPTLHDVAWLYCSDDVRRLWEENGNNFVNAQSILENAQVRFSSPVAGILPPTTFSNTSQIRNDVAILFKIEDDMVDAFVQLTSLLNSQRPIQTSALESDLESFGKALNDFDDFDMGENSVFAVFDGLVLNNTDAADARSSSLTFKSCKDGAEHTKVFTLQGAVTEAASGRPRELRQAAA